MVLVHGMDSRVRSSWWFLFMGWILGLGALGGSIDPSPGRSRVRTSWWFVRSPSGRLLHGVMVQVDGAEMHAGRGWG